MAERTAEAPDEGRAPDAVTQSNEWAKAQMQQTLAAEGRAENQCGYCGSYRLDGQPPILHQSWCAVPALHERWAW